MKRPEAINRCNRSVQDYVAHLERVNAAMHTKWEAAVGKADDATPVILHDYGVTADRPLPEFGLIRFRLGPEIDQFIDVQKNRERGGGLTIRAGRCLTIEPNASNTVIVHWSKMR